MPGLLPSLSCFLDDFNSCAASTMYCVLLQSQVAFYFYGYCYHLFFVLLISCNCVALWAGLSFFSFFVLSFASEQVKRILFFFELFLFFHSLVFARSALFYKSLLYFNCFIRYCFVYCCFRHVGEKCVVVVPRKCKCPYRHRFK